MQETEAFKKFEKTTRVMAIVSRVGSIVILAASVILFMICFFVDFDYDPICIVVIALMMIYFLVMMPMLFICIRRRALITLYRSYARVLSRNPYNAVYEISQSCGIAPDKIISDISRLNELGFFEGVKVDEDSKKVTYGEAEPDYNREFLCPVCGGKTPLTEGQEDRCAFCGAVVEAAPSCDDAEANSHDHKD